MNAIRRSHANDRCSESRRRPAAVSSSRRCWAELKKVHWPTRKETQAATVVVIVVVVDRRRSTWASSTACSHSVIQSGAAVDDGDRGDKKWYVVHTYSGYEHKVKAALEERIRALGKHELFGEILVPGREGRRAGQGQEEDVVAEVLPRLHPRQHGAERRDLAHRQVDAEGHRLRRRRHRPDPSLDLGDRGARDHASDGGGRGQAEAQGALRERRERQGRSTARSRTSTASSRK